MSIRPSVGRSISPFVSPLVRNDRVEKWENAHFRSCPPVRKWWPCIRPCFLPFVIQEKATKQVTTIFANHVLICDSGAFNLRNKACPFLLADTQLHRRHCPPVGPSVCPSVRLMICKNESESGKTGNGRTQTYGQCWTHPLIELLSHQQKTLLDHSYLACRYNNLTKQDDR